MGKTLRICSKGHKYYKSSDCNTCPICEASVKTDDEFFMKISSPARRGLENAGIKEVKDLAFYTEKEILNLHGVGPSAIPIMKEYLEKLGLSFRDR